MEDKRNSSPNNLAIKQERLSENNDREGIITNSSALFILLKRGFHAAKSSRQKGEQHKQTPDSRFALKHPSRTSGYSESLEQFLDNDNSAHPNKTLRQ